MVERRSNGSRQYGGKDHRSKGSRIRRRIGMDCATTVGKGKKIKHGNRSAWDINRPGG